MNALARFYKSSIGGKMTVAVTGLLLVGFVIVHLTGNLLMYEGRTAMNDYAAWLKSFGGLLYVARAGLLAVFILHVMTAIRLSRANKLARPVAYAHESTVQASLASRTMLMSGLMVLAYVVYHLAHFTFGWVKPSAYDMTEVVGDSTRHDVYGMVVAGFKNPLISLSYIVANALLAWHLSHGVASVLQSLGLQGPKYATLVKRIGLGVAGLIGLGFISIPLAVMVGIIKA